MAYSANFWFALHLAAKYAGVTAARMFTIAHRLLDRASSLVNASRSVFQSLGVALLATVLQTTTSTQMANFRPTATGPVAASQAQQAFGNAFLSGLNNAYLLTFGVAAAAILIALLLPGWPFQKKTTATPPAFGEGSDMPVVPDTTSSSAALKAASKSQEKTLA